ncbi:peptidyl-prolyl cis-trans isomerase [Chitinimonas prasina]|uniref:peptidylprolyl isomerase n=1 Tax=Chitinimonas prasina TaxID=1434937 RepID=A0ABQ5YJZ5_9NEIS|nr:peptidylprolyl isomerase [Chitinimonas prasina]GLR15321.1 peptidyl-prolyl cis-trans isomerase [Chitinimonas prasina]
MIALTARVSLVLGATAALACSLGVSAAAQRTPADIIKQSAASDWRPLDGQNTLVMELNGGQVIFELAPRFAPRHAANIRKLARNGYYDGLAVIRVQDNFVTQWGDPVDEEKEPAKVKPLGDAEAKLPAEFSIAYRGLPIARLKDADGFAPVTGFSEGMPVAADPKKNRAWIPHCYGVIGAGRGNTVDSSNGSSLYVIIGQAPRALDLNITVVGRVLKGMELLSGLPRGGSNMGFYDKPEQHVPLQRVRLLADIPAAERPALEVLRTDTPTWQALVESRRHASGDWYVHSAEHTNVCNIGIPTRPLVPAAS